VKIMGKFCSFLLRKTREKFMKILRKLIIIFLLSVWAGKRFEKRWDWKNTWEKSIDFPLVTLGKFSDNCFLMVVEPHQDFLWTIKRSLNLSHRFSRKLKNFINYSKTKEKSILWLPKSDPSEKFNKLEKSTFFKNSTLSDPWNEIWVLFGIFCFWDFFEIEIIWGSRFFVRRLDFLSLLWGS
jgi:hypothetical protein